jgi:hypothetical protein
MFCSGCIVGLLSKEFTVEIRVAGMYQVEWFLALPRIDLRIWELAALAELVVAATVGSVGAGAARFPLANFWMQDAMKALASAS